MLNLVQHPEFALRLLKKLVCSANSASFLTKTGFNLCSFRESGNYAFRQLHLKFRLSHCETQIPVSSTGMTRLKTVIVGLDPTILGFVTSMRMTRLKS